MHILEQRTLGIVILVLLGTLVMVKQLTTGAILEKPKGSPLVWLVNTFNLFFLLVVNPLGAILLIIQHMATIDATHLVINLAWLLTIVEIAGMVLYCGGFFLMAWALVSLGRNYQVGGSAPRAGDHLVTSGLYRWMRHPMYVAALSISLGLACLLQSLVLFFLFVVYSVLIALLIPIEEKGLKQAYGKR